MKFCEFSKKKKVWLCVLAAIAVLTLAAIIICAVLLPDVFREHYTKIIAPEKLAKDLDNSVKKAMMNVITPLTIVLLSAAAIILTLLFKNSSKDKYFTTKKITYLAIFTAISYIFYMFVKFNLPIFPFFLDFQISDMPALLCGFMMGPVGGVIVIVLKVALKLPFTTTDGIGELGDLILGIAFVLPAALVYKYHRTKKGAIMGLVCGSLICVAASLLINRYILFPFYMERYFGGSINGLVGALSELYPNLTADNFYAYCLGAGILPFNILRCLLSGLVTFFVYKRCEKLFVKMFGNTRTKKETLNTANTAETID